LKSLCKKVDARKNKFRYVRGGRGERGLVFLRCATEETTQRKKVRRQGDKKNRKGASVTEMM